MPPNSMRWSVGTLHRAWYAACTSAQLLVTRPLGCTILDEPLVVFRGPGGAPVALADRCLHRNAKLSEGDVFDGCLGCPYHGWTYDGEGRLVNVPSESPENRVREGKAVTSFPCKEVDGLVWVWLGDGPPDREPLHMPWYHEDGWRTYYMTTDFENGVTNLVENFMDVPHTVFVHAHWFRNAKRRHGEATCRRTPEDVLITYHHKDDIGFADWALNPERLPMTHTDRFISPNVTRVDYQWGKSRQFVISSQITPISPFRSRVYTAIAFRFGFLTPLLEPFFRWYTRRVIEQDVEIMRNQGQNLQRYGEPHFDATEADWVHRYIEDLREWREGGEQGPAPAVEERRIGFWI